jgi:MFS family permease
MTNKKLDLKIIIPVLLSFFVMSFVDLVGIGVDRAKADFELSDTMAQLIPSVAFLWFFLLSVPVGIFQDRNGKKLTLVIGMSITVLGLIIPFIVYSFPVLLIGFAMLGIGNTIIPFFGGIPATAAIARTSVAIKSGLQTRLTGIIHAIGLLASMFLLGSYMSRIPLAALGGVLMVTAWRMNEWKAIK